MTHQTQRPEGSRESGEYLEAIQKLVMATPKRQLELLKILPPMEDDALLALSATLEDIANLYLDAAERIVVDVRRRRSR